VVIGSDAVLSTLRYINLAAAGPQGVIVTLTGTTVGVSVTGGEGTDVLTGGGGGDTLEGSAGADTLTGAAGADRLQGDAGDDVFAIAISSDHPAGETLVGGADNDVIRYTSTAGAVLTLAAGVDVEEARIADAAGSTTGTTGEGIDATLAAVTTLTGNDGANALTGNALANMMAGGAGADTITGGAGADTIAGGADDDIFRYATSGDFIAATPVRTR
jgi:Ca2+-binding RTX toxin-like protein